MIFLQGKAVREDGLNFAVSPATVQLCATGRTRIEFSIPYTDQKNYNFAAPELYNGASQQNDLTIEKVTDLMQSYV